MKFSLSAVREWSYSKFKWSRPDPKEYSTIVGVGSIVPVQIEAYFLALNKYLDEKSKVLDVGFGLGYGLNILAIKAREVNGVDIDKKVLDYCMHTLVGRNPRLNFIDIFDGYNLPFAQNSFDIVTCVDVIEHVEDYERLIGEMLRVSTKGVFLSTPNRRSEYTNKNGTPKNYWHLREWNYDEFDQIIRRFGPVDWNFINGPIDGPFTVSVDLSDHTIALSPFIFKNRQK